MASCKLESVKIRTLSRT